MPDTRHFDAMAIALHWSIAALIVIAFAIGLTVDDFPEGWKGAVINAHALIGLAVLALTALRLYWRLSHKPPPLPPEVGPLFRRMAALAHAGLYLLMAAVPLIGIPILLYRGRGLDFGLFQIASPFERTRAIFGPWTDIHELAAYALIGLAAGHALAALYHHFIRRDAVLLQMLRTKG